MMVHSNRLKMGRTLLTLMLALIASVSCSGCSYKVPGVKNYPLSERRAAVMEHLKNKYGEEFKEIAVEPAGVLAKYDTFHLYPKAGTRDDKFIASCSSTNAGLSISDGYFGILIHDEYENVMNEIVGEVCDEYFLMVSTQPDAIWNDRYNKDTKITDLYRKGEYKSYQSALKIHIKESSLSNQNIKDMLQTIAQAMIDKQLISWVSADIVKDEQYDDFKDKTVDEINNIASKFWKDYFIFSEEKNSPNYIVSIYEDKASGNLKFEFPTE